jgi:hypothetical protein
MTMAVVPQLAWVNVVLYTLFSLLIVKMILHLKRARTTALRGPKNISFIFGFYRYIQEQEDSGVVYENWAKEYGPAFIVPGPLGTKRTVICDPKANAHFYSRETYGYVQPKLARVFIENLVCPEEDELHKPNLFFFLWTVWSRITLG